MTARRDRGMATAEFAAVTPALLVLVLAALAGIGGMVTKLRCVDAARDAALMAARSQGAASDGPSGRSDAPPGATIDVRAADGWVRAVVRAPVHPLGPRGPGFIVEGDATAAMEPTS